MPSRTGSVPKQDPVLPLWSQTTVRDTTESTQVSQKYEPGIGNVAAEIHDPAIRFDKVQHESGNGDVAAEIHNATVRLDKVRGTLERLRQWHSWETERRQSLKKYLLRTFLPRRPPCPSHDELKELATFFFPLRKLLQVTVCDIGKDRFERHETTIGGLEPCKSFPGVDMHTIV